LVRDLGGYTTLADRKEAARVAFISGGLVFAIGAAASLRLGQFMWTPIALVWAFIVYFMHRRFAMKRAPKGTVDLVDDDEQGVMLVLHRKGPGLRIPLSQAIIRGRTRTLATVGPVRMQIEVKWGERSVVGNLAIPFRAAEGDVEGVLPADYDLDRIASRAFDALSYESKASGG
jgi:hypothetical protein